MIHLLSRLINSAGLASRVMPSLPQSPAFQAASSLPQFSSTLASPQIRTVYKKVPRWTKYTQADKRRREGLFYQSSRTGRAPRPDFESVINWYPGPHPVEKTMLCSRDAFGNSGTKILLKSGRD